MVIFFKLFFHILWDSAILSNLMFNFCVLLYIYIYILSHPTLMTRDHLIRCIKDEVVLDRVSRNQYQCGYSSHDLYEG